MAMKINLCKMIMNEHHPTDKEAHNNLWLGHVPFTPRNLIKCIFNLASDRTNKIFSMKKNCSIKCWFIESIYSLERNHSDVKDEVYWDQARMNIHMQ